MDSSTCMNANKAANRMSKTITTSSLANIRKATLIPPFVCDVRTFLEAGRNSGRCNHSSENAQQRQRNSTCSEATVTHQLSCICFQNDSANKFSHAPSFLIRHGFLTHQNVPFDHSATSQTLLSTFSMNMAQPQSWQAGVEEKPLLFLMSAIGAHVLARSAIEAKAGVWRAMSHKVPIPPHRVCLMFLSLVATFALCILFRVKARPLSSFSASFMFAQLLAASAHAHYGSKDWLTLYPFCIGYEFLISIVSAVDWICVEKELRSNGIVSGAPDSVAWKLLLVELALYHCEYQVVSFPILPNFGLLNCRDSFAFCGALVMQRTMAGTKTRISVETRDESVQNDC